MINEWNSGVEDFENIDKDLVKFYFDQAEKRLKSTLELSDRTTNRAYALLVGLVPTLTLIFTKLIDKYFSHGNVSDMTVIACWFGLLLGMYCLFLLLVVVMPRDMMQLGREPKAIVRPEYFNNLEYPKEASYKLQVITELEDYQLRIEYMDKQNIERVAKVTRALGAIVFGMIMFIIFLIGQTTTLTVE